MSWLSKLSDTYENAVKNKDLSGKGPMPLAHIYQQADIEITLDNCGNLLEAELVDKESTLVPATESSAGRTSGGAPHPLCDKLQYVAGDYKKYGGSSRPYFDDFKTGKEIKQGYLSLLSEWYDFSRNPFLSAVLAYVKKRTLIRDLVERKVLVLDTKGTLSSNEFIRWKVLIPGELCSEVWKRDDLIDSWSKFNASRQGGTDLCYVSGEVRPYSVNHPARIRYSGDKAKLISANDMSGYTFRGRFISSEQACVVSYEISQKAHAALRWLIERQAFKSNSMVILAWAVSGAKVPPLTDSTDMLGEEVADVEDDLGLLSDDSDSIRNSVSGDMGQAYAKNLKKKIWGYKKELKDRDDIVVMSLDSATPGRMSIMYYREIKGSEFLASIEKYHRQYAWRQDFGKKRRFTGAPGLHDIAQMAYAGKSNDSLTKATIERLIPVVVDGTPMPKDLVVSICRRAASPLGLEEWEFNKILGMACGIYAGSHGEGGYKMSLEKDRVTRDYLYGRLLAVADRLEGHALNVSDENRDTSAIKLMQRFAEKPYTTWLQIEKNLVPYNSRLKAKRPKSWSFYNSLLDEIHAKFKTDDYTRNTPLSGEFLLGFHCQRMALWPKEAKTEDENN